MPEISVGSARRPPVDIPKSAYADDQVAAAEIERVFNRSWVFVGFESEIPERGDYVQRRLGSDQVLLTRSEAGSVHVLLNACTHRGTALCEATLGNTAHFRCSYHGWTFANDGRLVGVPGLRSHYSRDFDKARLALREARAESYRGFVFATWDREAPPLADYLGDIRFYLDALLNISSSGWEVVAPPQRVRVRGNWKYFQDNTSGDGYHLQTTHALAFEQGVFDRDPGVERDARVVATDGGHALRIGYGRRETPDFWLDGMPLDELPHIAENLTPQEREVLDKSEFMHGGIFPNAAFITNSQSEKVADLGDVTTRFLVWRLHHPLGPNETEIYYWVLVPRHFPDDWKRVSYAMQARVQSAGGLFFEHDDFENTFRLDAANRGSRARALDQDLSLGADFEIQRDMDGWPGQVQQQGITEHNQRAFYRRYVEMMGDAL
ncbi:aromatic ring-hydroxylating oxygenase subunit alpha [Microtetraspora malaysiensis]|uniref:aromatic ring-hydroxylating oxygenase subunit alpha n=1 Tax=Microtetraspora malaysiensis TaxID=161358 RepID=UPI003D8A3E3D